MLMVHNARQTVNAATLAQLYAMGLPVEIWPAAKVRPVRGRIVGLRPESGPYQDNPITHHLVSVRTEDGKIDEVYLRDGR